MDHIKGFTSFHLYMVPTLKKRCYIDIIKYGAVVQWQETVDLKSTQ